ncbi:MAG TPA: hypothetical protein VL588_05380 [Bdellovibrionota bacterium]|nr:hypothetical protein [Bdellovibrionota bacterium]
MIQLRGISWVGPALALVAWAWNSPAFADCTAGSHTQLAVGCANAWSAPEEGTSESLYPWSESAWSGAQGARRLHRLNPSSCAQPQIEELSSIDHMARVNCGSGSVWTNLDYLACQDTNLAHRPTLLVSGEAGGCDAFGVFAMGHGARASRSFDRMLDSMGPILTAPAREVLTRAEHRVHQIRANAEHDQTIVEAPYDADFTPHSDQGSAAHRQADRNLLARMIRAQTTLTSQAGLTTVFSPNAEGEVCEGALIQNPVYEAGRRGLAVRAQGGTATTRARRMCRLFNYASAEVTKWLNDARTEAHQHYLAASATTSLGESQQEYEEAEAGAILEDHLINHSYQEDAASTYGDEVYRQVLFAGLTDAERSRALPTSLGGRSTGDGALRMAGRATEFDNIFGASLVYIHNGYVYGGYRHTGTQDTSLDCSSFMTDVLGGASRARGVPGTRDFTLIHRLLNHDRMSSDDRAQAERLSDLSSCFTAVDYRTSAPRPGDIVVTQSYGHVVMVHSYDPSTGRVQTAQAAGGYHDTADLDMDEPLYEPSCNGASRPGDWGVRPVRGDLRVLRLRADLPSSPCPLSWSGS